jgi:hypothetical protein
MPDQQRIIEGYYTCPVPFNVTADALDATYTVILGGHSLTLTLPRSPGAGGEHEGLTEPRWHYTEHDIPQSRVIWLAPYWGRPIRWDATTRDVKAAGVRRFRLATETTGDDDHIRTVASHIAEAAPAWWAATSAWIEVVHAQDLSRLGPVEPGLHFNNTTLWAHLNTLNGHPIHGGGDVLPVGSSRATVVWPDTTAITATELQSCITHAEHLGPPPPEWLIIRDARSLCAGHDFRRAILDAGLAAELAVTELIRTHLANNGHTPASIDHILEQNRMLGKRCAYWINQCSGALPTDYQTKLVDRRNDATHAGHSFPEGEVREAITIAADIVEQLRPLPT